MTLPKLIPKLMPNAYYPDVFELQLRMDAPASDALAHLELTNNAHAEIIERLLVFKNYYPLFFETTEESSSPIIGLDIVKQLQKRLPFQTSKLSDTEKQKTV